MNDSVNESINSSSTSIGMLQVKEKAAVGVPITNPDSLILALKGAIMEIESSKDSKNKNKQWDTGHLSVDGILSVEICSQVFLFLFLFLLNIDHCNGFCNLI